MKIKIKNIDVMDSVDSDAAIQAAWNLIRAGGLNLAFPGEKEAIGEIKQAFPCWDSDQYSDKEIASILIEARLTYANLGLHDQDEMAMFIVNVEWPLCPN